MSTARAIYQARIGKRWTQQDMASALGVSVGIVSKWERGAAAPRLKMLVRIAEATGRPLDEFEAAGEAEAAARLGHADEIAAAVRLLLGVAVAAKTAEPERFRVPMIGAPGRPWADPAVAPVGES